MENALRIVLFLMFFSGLTACATNPVTKKSELQFISESDEISYGQKNYLPARQSQGGDYSVDKELTEYVQSVASKLVAVSDRPYLPYEFVVINNSVPNAWAMPGGKIAINRGLLYEINSEAELAAVLGHEIVHSAARHSVKKMELDGLLQVAQIGVAIAAKDKKHRDLLISGSAVGSELVSAKYGRNEELESDLYGMQYMKKAGYDPSAAVILQETFVRLSQGRKLDWHEGLFASHPPSEERVEANKSTLAMVGAGGEWGREIYAKKMAYLNKTKPAYVAYDSGIEALNNGDNSKAAGFAKKALAIEPKEARFHELNGKIAFMQHKYQKALVSFNQAIKLQPGYFKSHLMSGLSLMSLDKKAEAEPYLKRSIELFATDIAYNMMGDIAESSGDLKNALENYKIAAGYNSEIGRESKQQYFKLHFNNQPHKYLKFWPDNDIYGRIYAVVQNPTNMTVGRVIVRITKLNPNTGRAVAQSQPLLIGSGIPPGKVGSVQLQGVTLRHSDELRLFRVFIEKAELAE